MSKGLNGKHCPADIVGCAILNDACNRLLQWRDGGRNVTGIYKIGVGDSAIDVEFSLKSTCDT